MESPEVPDEARFEQCDAADFHIVVHRFLDAYPNTLSAFSCDEYGKMLCFLNEKQTAGYALKDGDELVSVFNMGSRDIGKQAVEHAIQQGARRLDAFDGILRHFYERIGFVVEKVEKNFTAGDPDVIFMVLDETNHKLYLLSLP